MPSSEGPRRPQHIRNLELIKDAAALITLTDEVQRFLDVYEEENERDAKEAEQTGDSEEAVRHRDAFINANERVREARELQEELAVMSSAERRDPGVGFLQSLRATHDALTKALQDARDLFPGGGDV